MFETVVAKHLDKPEPVTKLTMCNLASGLLMPLSLNDLDHGVLLIHGCL